MFAKPKVEHLLLPASPGAERRDI